MATEEIYQRNVDLIEARWQSLASKVSQTSIDYQQCELLEGQDKAVIINGIQLNSSFDSTREAKIIIDELPSDCTHISIYGIGNGRVIEQALAQFPDAHIDVYLFNIMAFRLALTLYDFSEWLNNELVVLHDASLHRYVRHPFVAIAPELTLAPDDTAVLRDRVCLELDARYIAKHKSGTNDFIRERIAQNNPLFR